MKDEKLNYFKDSCDRIRSLSPYEFLIRDEKNADHSNNIIHDKKTLRFREVWREITPPNILNHNLDDNDNQNNQDNLDNLEN
mgnify:FL=1